MAFDYTPIKATVKRLIEDRGRSFTLIIRDTTPDNAAQPWRGPAEPGTDITLVAIGVNIDSVAESFFGTEYIDEDDKLIRRTGKSILFAADSVSGIDMTLLDIITDGSIKYKVDRVNELAPGSTPILYEVDIKL